MHTRVNSNGQVVIPAEIRKRLGIKDDGTYLRIETNFITKQIILMPITREYIHSFRGKYKGKGLMKALIREKQTNLDDSETNH